MVVLLGFIRPGVGVVVVAGVSVALARPLRCCVAVLDNTLVHTDCSC